MPALPGTTVPMGSSPHALPMTNVTFDDTIDDGQGGSITFHLSIDDQTGEFGGTFQFTIWHGDGGGTINGLANVDGSFDMTGGFFTQIHFSFNPVTMEDGLNTVSIYGTVNLESDRFSSASASMNIYLRDGVSLETVWISNYTMDLSEGPDADFNGEPDYVDATVSGRVSLPNHGYVYVQASTPFRYYAGFSLPSSGVLLFSGSGGRSGRFVVINTVPESPVSLGYYVEADLDGIPGYEWNWSDHSWP